MFEELLFSTAFVLVGSLVFHFSSLISGFNIYRELPPQLATVSTVTVGIALFALSPVSLELLSQQSTENIPPSDIQTMAGFLDWGVLGPFLFSALGLGLVVGSFVVLHARRSFFRWFRRKTGMRFLIYSYSLSWDSFLDSVKSRGRVTVVLPKKRITGKLVAHSVRDEPREIKLADYSVVSTSPEDDSGPEVHEGGRILITGEDIQTIEADAASFNAHYDHMPHYSQAFYCLVAAVGFTLLGVSACCAAVYVGSNGMSELQAFYLLLSVVFTVTALGMLLIAYWVSKLDFRTGRGSRLLRPLVPVVSLFGAGVLGLVLTHTLVVWIGAHGKALWIGGGSFTAVCVLGGVWVWSAHRRVMRGFFDKVDKLFEYKPSLLSQLLRDFHSERDYNKPAVEEYRRLKDLLEQRYVQEAGVRKFFQWVDDLKKDCPALDGEEVNVLGCLQAHRERFQ